VVGDYRRIVITNLTIDPSSDYGKLGSDQDDEFRIKVHTIACVYCFMDYKLEPEKRMDFIEDTRELECKESW
jgi:hypothetical protein